MSLGTLPYQEVTIAHPCAATVATELIRNLFDTPLYATTCLLLTPFSGYKHASISLSDNCILVVSCFLTQINRFTVFQPYALLFVGLRNRVSWVGIVTGYRLDVRGVGVWVLLGSGIFSMSSRSVLGPTQPPVQCVRGVSGKGVKLTTHLQLVLMSRKCGSIHTFLHTPSWRRLYLYWLGPWLVMLVWFLLRIISR
jgi:hypothetical protein